jgi:hypothetical protein
MSDPLAEVVTLLQPSAPFSKRVKLRRTSAHPLRTGAILPLLRPALKRGSGNPKFVGSE